MPASSAAVLDSFKEGNTLRHRIREVLRFVKKAYLSNLETLNKDQQKLKFFESFRAVIRLTVHDSIPSQE